MKKLRRITDAEVIAEFLKAEFYHSEYENDRHKFEAFVYNPDLTDETENAIRRALLFRRRGTMWRELPEDTQWWEVELDFDDLGQVNVFPRAQWRRISDGDFQALHVVERIRRQLQEGKTDRLLSKITRLHGSMKDTGIKSTIMLIGIDETLPVTVLEGNHRFVSALLLPREAMFRRIRPVCGFSPEMERCCWYKTDLSNLLQYTKNRIKHLWSRDADVSRFKTQDEGSASYANAVGFPNIKSE